MSDCVFCERIKSGDYDMRYNHHNFGGVVRFTPLNPVVPGHLLFVPVEHTEWRPLSNLHAASNAAGAMYYASLYGMYSHSGHGIESFNIITSNGSPATQTIPHIHVHYVPRREGDGLHLPWTGQKK